MKVLQTHRLGISPAQQNQSMTQQQENKSMYNQNISSRKIMGPMKLMMSTSPSCKQKMSPRTMQPSNTAATVPPAPLFTAIESIRKQKKQLNRNIKEEYNFPDSDDSPEDPEDLPIPISTQSAVTNFAASNILSQQDNNDSQSRYQVDDLALNNQSHTFGNNLVEQRDQVKFEIAEGDHQMFDNSPNNYLGTADKAVESSNILTSKRVSPARDQTSPQRTEREDDINISPLELTSHLRTPSPLQVSSSQAYATFSSRQNTEFLSKQQAFELKKQDKIRKAQVEKLARETQEFEKNATFQPNLVANSPKRMLQVRQAQISPLSTSQNRSVKKFVQDQENYMFKSQKKINEQRAKRDHDMSRELTGTPMLNPKSERICQKIHSEFIHNKFTNKEGEVSEVQPQVMVSQEGPLPLAISEQQLSTTIKPALQTRKKKSPQTNSSAAARQLWAQKRTLAKAVPQMPTFKPKINQNSARLVQRQVQKHQKQHDQELANFEDFEKRVSITAKDFSLEIESENIRLRTEPDYFLSEQSSAQKGYESHVKRLNQAKTSQKACRAVESSVNTSLNVSRTKNSRSLLSLKRGPMIAEVKAQNEAKEAELARKQKENQTRKHNEKLLLKNFKKEFDAIMEELGLGQAQTKDDSMIGNYLQTNMSRDTIKSDDKLGQSSQEVTEVQVRVDVALILDFLGFLPNQTIVFALREPEAKTNYFDQYICILDDKDQKTAFKANLFTILAAIQSINLKDHYKLYGTFGTLQHHILEDIVQQVDLGNQFGGSSQQMSAVVSENTSSPVSLLLKALTALSMQPFPFSINHSHLVKMHLTFMNFYLNRKDNISKDHRISLEQEQKDKFKFVPKINKTQRSCSPPDKRTPINEPNRYYDELKRNIKERSAKIQSIKAEKQRAITDECTFKPTINAKSNKIAYRQVAEMHLSQSEFMKTYIVRDQDNLRRNNIDNKNNGDESEQIATEFIPVQATSQRDDGLENSGFQSRISNRINKMVREFVADKRTGKKGQDISTEQKEYEKSKDELSFKPDIAKSQLSLRQGTDKSPKNVQQRIFHQSPTTLKRASGSNSAGALLQPQMRSGLTSLSMFHQGKTSARQQQKVTKPKPSTYLQQRGKKSPVIGWFKPTLQQQTASMVGKHQSRPLTSLKTMTVENLKVQRVKEERDNDIGGGGDIMIDLFIAQETDDAHNSMPVQHQESCNFIDTPEFPGENRHNKHQTQLQNNSQLMYLAEDNNNIDNGEDDGHETDELTADFQGLSPKTLQAPPSVVDIHCFSTILQQRKEEIQPLVVEDDDDVELVDQLLKINQILVLDQASDKEEDTLELKVRKSYQPADEILKHQYLFSGQPTSSKNSSSSQQSEEQKEMIHSVQNNAVELEKNPFKILPKYKSQIAITNLNSNLDDRSSCLPSAFLRPTDATMSSQTPHMMQESNSQVSNNHGGEWSSEFAKIVSDVIIIDNTARQRQTTGNYNNQMMSQPERMIAGSIEPTTAYPDTLVNQLTTDQAPNSYSAAAAGEKMQITESLDAENENEDFDNAYELGESDKQLKFVESDAVDIGMIRTTQQENMIVYQKENNNLQGRLLNLHINNQQQSPNRFNSDLSAIDKASSNNQVRRFSDDQKQEAVSFTNSQFSQVYNDTNTHEKSIAQQSDATSSNAEAINSNSFMMAAQMSQQRRKTEQTSQQRNNSQM